MFSSWSTFIRHSCLKIMCNESYNLDTLYFFVYILSLFWFLSQMAWPSHKSDYFWLMAELF